MTEDDNLITRLDDVPTVLAGTVDYLLEGTMSLNAPSGASHYSTRFDLVRGEDAVNPCGHRVTVAAGRATRRAVRRSHG